MQESGLARHEGDLRTGAGEPLGVDELLHLLGSDRGGDSPARQQAIARYLSAAEGWSDAVKELGGAFAPAAPGLRERKAD